MASDLTNQGTKGPADSLPIPEALRALALITPAKAAAYNAAADEVETTEDKLQKIQIAFDVITKSGDAKEQSDAGSDLTSNIKSSIPGIPTKQDISLELMNQIQGIGQIVELLLPIWGAMQGTWQFLEGLGGLLSHFDQLLSILAPTDPKRVAIEAIKAAIEDSDFTEEDLKDPAKFKIAANAISVPEISGYTQGDDNSLGDTLDRFQPGLGLAAVPQSSSITTPPPVTSTVDFTGRVINSTELITPNPTPLEMAKAAGVVTHDMEEPPICVLANTNQFRVDPDPYKTFGNPIAAGQNEANLAADVSNVAAQLSQLADGQESLSEAAQTVIANPQQAFYLCLRAILADLVTYNFQTGQAGIGASNRSILWWNTATPQDPALDPAIVDKINNGVLLDPTDLTDIDDAISNLQQQATDAVNPSNSWGAMPGNLIWAALMNGSFSGTFDELIDQIPDKVAVNENVPNVNRTQIQNIIFNYTQAFLDPAVEDIPILMMTGESSIAAYTPAVQRWIETLIYFDNSTDNFGPIATQISSGPILFRAAVQEATLDYTRLYTALTQHTLTYNQTLELDALAALWDSVIVGLVVDEDFDPLAIEVLTEILAAKPLLPGSDPMTLAIDSLEEATLTIGGPIGTDLAYMVGVVGAVIRASYLLSDFYITQDQEDTRDSRLKQLLQSAQTMSEQVEFFPNAGMLGRIAESI